MDISYDLSDIFNDESVTKVIKELDDFGIFGQNPGSRSYTQKTPQRTNLTLKFGHNALNDFSEQSSFILYDEFSAQKRRNWIEFENRFDSSVASSLRPVENYVFETFVMINNKRVYFINKRRKYVENLIDETISGYKELWKEVYLPFGDDPNNFNKQKKTGGLLSFHDEILGNFKAIANRIGCKGVKTTESCQNDANTVDCDDTDTTYVDTKNYKGEFIELMSKMGVTQFYHLLDYLLIVMEKSKYEYKTCYAIDLVTAMINVMPELCILLIIPKNKDSKIMFERKCYFRILCNIIRKNLQKINFETEETLPRVYMNALKGIYRPFYMNIVSENGKNDYMSVISTVYLLYRLLVLVEKIVNICMDYLFVSDLNDSTVNRLKKKIRKYIFIPLFGIRQLHELFIPLVGECKVGSEKISLDYLNLIKMYLYPPPPLYLLRLKFLDIIRNFVSFGIDYKRGYTRINDSLRGESTIAGEGQRVGNVLKKYVHLFIFGASFFLLADFMKKSVDWTSTFFGLYFVKVPHFRLNACFIDELAVVEEHVYKIQTLVIRILEQISNYKMLTDNNMLGSKSVGLVQDTIIKRLLILCWHYKTGSHLDERINKCIKTDDYRKRVYNKRSNAPNSCHGSCKTIVPYNINTLIGYLNLTKPGKITLTTHSKNISSLQIKTLVADEIEQVVKNTPCSIDYSSTAIPKTINYSIHYNPPLEIKNQGMQDKCQLECLLYCHMIANPASEKHMKTLRDLTTLAALELLTLNVCAKKRAPFDDLTPLWSSLAHTLTHFNS